MSKPMMPVGIAITSSPMTIGEVLEHAEAACVVCGKNDQARQLFTRPAFPLKDRPPQELQAIESWQSVVPERAIICCSHLVEAVPALKRVRDRRLVTLAFHDVWFGVFGHPLGRGKLLWREATRTPLTPPAPVAAVAPTEDEARTIEHRVKRRQRKRGWMSKMRRIGFKIPKFAVRGMRLR